MMGVGCSEKGKILLIDDTKINATHLASHFVFKKRHLTNFKADSLKSILLNKFPNSNFESLTEPIYYSDEETIKEVFQPIDIIISTFDNYRVKLRLKK